MVCGPGPAARHPWRPRAESAASIGWRSSSDVSSRVAAVSRFSQAWSETDDDSEIVSRLRIIVRDRHLLGFDVRTGRCGWHEICSSKFRVLTENGSNIPGWSQTRIYCGCCRTITFTPGFAKLDGCAEEYGYDLGVNQLI